MISVVWTDRDSCGSCPSTHSAWPDFSISPGQVAAESEWVDGSYSSATLVRPLLRQSIWPALRQAYFETTALGIGSPGIPALPLDERVNVCQEF